MITGGVLGGFFIGAGRKGRHIVRGGQSADDAGRPFLQGALALRLLAAQAFYECEIF